MGTDAPTTIFIPVHCAPKKAPCPNCGKHGHRKRKVTREVRTVAFKSIAYLEVTCGEYAARCDCCKTFRNTPEGVLPKAHYDNKVRDLVLDRILKDGMNVEQTLDSLRREFLLNLSTGFVYDVLRDRVEQLDMSEHRRKVLEQFSGTLCVDELHLGRFTLLLATDPLSDLPVAFALVAANDQDHMRRFLQNLKTWGLMPRVVITDDSKLYPAVLAELWPEAEHQLCVFHIIKNINKLILDAVRRLRTAMSRRGKAGRQKKRGRKSKKAKAAAGRRGRTVKEKAHFVFKHRYLIVKRRENLTESERGDLTQMLEYLPELSTLRQFADRIYWLFDTPKDFHQASCRRAVIVRDPAFRAVQELVKAMEQLDEEKFPKLMAYLNSPMGQRVRTNNHVERTNRMIRFFEKVRYKWRRRRTLVRFVVLKLDEIWSSWSRPDAKAKTTAHATKLTRPNRPCDDGIQPRRIA
jgi:transposase-like protein